MNQNIQFSCKDELSLSLTVPIGVKKEMFASDGTKIQWIECGSGKPLVISPALGTPFISWLPAIQSLSTVFRLIFILTRGGVEGPIHQNPTALTVERRADDLTELINSLKLQEYYIAAHSSGVSPVILGLNKLKIPPIHVCLISSRYDIGPPIGAESLLQRARKNPGFTKLVQSIVVSFSPPSVAEVIREQLHDFNRMESLLYAFEESRAFNYITPIRLGITITFIIAEYDPEDVRNTTRHIINRYENEPWTLVDVAKVGHFFIQEDGAAAAALITRSLCS